MNASAAAPVSASGVARPAAPAVSSDLPVSDYHALLDGCTSVQIQSIAAGSEASRDHHIAKAVDGSASTYYSTKVNPSADAVEVQIMLAGRFNIRKIDIDWKYKPASFQIQFSRWDGERFEWLPVVEKTTPPDGTAPHEIMIGNAGFGFCCGAVKILLRPDQEGLLGISDITIWGQKSLIAPKRIEASSIYSKDYSGQMLCLPKGVWSSNANPKDPVALTIELAGCFHVRKLTIRWTHGGPRTFTLSTAHEEHDTFELYPEVNGPEVAKEPVQTVIFTDLFYGRSTGFLRIEMSGLQQKYIGIEELQIVGDLDLAWRADRIAMYEQAMTAQSPKSSVGKVHKAAARPVASPVVPVPKPIAASPAPSQEGYQGPDRSGEILASKDREIANLREENANLKAEAAKMRSKLREAKSIIDSIA